MVASLFDLCRIEIRNGVENMTMPHVHLLPLKERKSILEAVLMHGTINEPNCLEILGLTEFLKDFSSLNMQLNEVDDRNFLDRAAVSFSTVLPNGRRLGDNIAKLELNVYTLNRNYKSVLAVNFPHVINLIAQCPRLTNLNLQLLEAGKDEGFEIEKKLLEEGKIASGAFFSINDGPGLLNKSKSLAPCLSIFDNLDELSLSNYSHLALFKSTHPLPTFKSLNSLRLVNCYLDGTVWSQLLGSIQETLTSLYFEEFDIQENTDQVPCILLVPLPNLKWLTAKNTDCWMIDPDLFLKNLMACCQLEYIYLEMDERTLCRYAQLEFAQQSIKATVDVELKLYHKAGDDKILERGSEFIFVDLLGEKVKSFYLHLDAWDQRLMAALKHLVNTCRGLTSFQLSLFGGMVLDEISQELKIANSLMAPLFKDEFRASKLRQLTLLGKYDESVLKSIFENCLNVDDFQIRHCPQLSDHHLVEWANRGVKLSIIKLFNCENITDDGLIPIIKSSGAKLEVFGIYKSPLVSRLTWMVLIEYCRYIKSANFPDADLEKISGIEMFYEVCLGFILVNNLLLLSTLR